MTKDKSIRTREVWLAAKQRVLKRHIAANPGIDLGRIHHAVSDMHEAIGAEMDKIMGKQP